MNEVTRYDLTEDVSTGELDITPVPERMQGRYVAFEDYEALQQQLSATTNSLTNAQEALKSAEIEADTVQAGVMELKAQRDALAEKSLPADVAEIIDSGDLESILFASDEPFSEQYRIALYKFRQLRSANSAPAMLVRMMCDG